MDAPLSIHIAHLRREIEAILELNRLYFAQRTSDRDGDAYDKRRIRLEEIKRELAALRPSP